MSILKITKKTSILLSLSMAIGCSSDVDPDQGKGAAASGQPAASSPANTPPPFAINMSNEPEPTSPMNPSPAAEIIPEICDGTDNDADGRVDESGCTCTDDTACFAGPPEARGIGECRDGTRTCDSQGEVFGACQGSIGPSDELCDELDNDCDGVIDESCCDSPPCEPDNMDDPSTDEGLERFVVGQQEQTAPVDFIMAIDNSGSMRDTVRQVEANLGTFSTRLANANIDYRMILVSERGTGAARPDVCVPPPMAGPNCSDTDRFTHLDEKVGSHSAFQDIIECYDGCDDDNSASFKNRLRPGSLLQVVVVSDDESRMSWHDFKAEMSDRGRGDFALHGVVGLQDRGCVADVGDQYITGSNETSGALLHICDHDWGQVLDVLFESTIQQLQRTFVLIGEPEPGTIAVYLEVGGQRTALDQWMYDEANRMVVIQEGVQIEAGSVVIVTYTRR